MASQQLTLASVRKLDVLVIEDNADQWFVIRWALHQRFSEVEPRWIADPMQALIYLETCLDKSEDLPQLILLDLCLTGCSVGLNMLRLLKKSAKLYSEIPVIVLSQFGDAQTIKAAYDQGANSYIIKPISYPQWLDYFTLFRVYWWNQVKLTDLNRWNHKSVGP